MRKEVSSRVQTVERVKIERIFLLMNDFENSFVEE